MAEKAQSPTRNFSLSIDNLISIFVGFQVDNMFEHVFQLRIMHESSQKLIMCFAPPLSNGSALGVGEFKMSQIGLTALYFEHRLEMTFLIWSAWASRESDGVLYRQVKNCN